MKYALSVEVKLVELPLEPEPIVVKPGGDPMQVIGDLANKAFSAPVAHPFGFIPPAGLDFRRQAIVGVEDFSRAQEIIERFNDLFGAIELNSIPMTE